MPRVTAHVASVSQDPTWAACRANRPSHVVCGLRALLFQKDVVSQDLNTGALTTCRTPGASPQPPGGAQAATHSQARLGRSAVRPGPGILKLGSLENQASGGLSEAAFRTAEQNPQPLRPLTAAPAAQAT